MGVKLFEFFRRVEGTTPDQFTQHWRTVHAPLITDEATLRRHVRRYELNIRLDADRARDTADAPGWDGVAVLWFDSVDDMRALSAEPAMEALRADAPNARADERLIVITAEPDTIIDTGHRAEAQAKMVCILRRTPGLDLDAFHAHWLNHHGGLFQTIPELRDPLWGYDQNHGLRDPNAAFDGVTEQWFESYDSFVESLRAPSHETVVNPDVASFLDPASINFIMAGQPIVALG
jgi:uncharacterized protein (TIGR02118 family)